MTGKRDGPDQARKTRLLWWAAIAAAILLALKLGAAFWAIRQAS